MIHWDPAECSDRAAPDAAGLLLDRAIKARPDNALLRLKRADLDLDRFDFAAAATALESALGIDPGLTPARPRLARCYNAMGRHRDAIETLSGIDEPAFERALALVRLGLGAEAEHELRALLGLHPGHRPACRQLGKILRRSGRAEELADLCETLHARGAAHAQLFYTWGSALALAGRDEEARGLLLDPSRITRHALPVPEGFADIAEFNVALAEEILGNPFRLSDFPAEDEANRGSSRVHALFAGRRPELVRSLLERLQSVIGARGPDRRPDFDPWSDARPQRAHLRAWGLIQSGSDYEEWHSHPGGWMSGVYYVRVPGCVTADGDGPGCIEFGPPTAVARERPGFVPVRRHAPVEGHLLLAPSHYAHRTIPTGAAEHRISFAFDIVPG